MPIVSLRAARLADWARLFDWRNHPSTYQYFDTPEPITLEAHLLWLDAIIVEGGRLFIIEAQTRDAREHVGTIRLDAVLDQPEAKTISITIDAQARGQRYGHLALEKLIERTSRKDQSNGGNYFQDETFPISAFVLLTIGCVFVYRGWKFFEFGNRYVCIWLLGLLMVVVGWWHVLAWILMMSAASPLHSLALSRCHALSRASLFLLSVRSRRVSQVEAA